jgi:hypothetical protein
MGFTAVKTYLSASMAHVDKGLLEQHGLVALVENEHAIGADGLLQAAFGHIQLSVPAADVAAATAILADSDGPPLPADEDDYVCPQCGSTNISDYGPYMWTIMFPVLFPLLFVRRTACHACRHTWERT